MISYC